MEHVVAFGFIFCAATAVFVGLHKEQIEEDGLNTVIASYL